MFEVYGCSHFSHSFYTSGAFRPSIMSDLNSCPNSGLQSLSNPPFYSLMINQAATRHAPQEVAAITKEIRKLGLTSSEIDMRSTVRRDRLPLFTDDDHVDVESDAAVFCEKAHTSERVFS